jgi:hypothetical protein
MINANTMDTPNLTKALSYILYHHASYKPKNMMTNCELRNLQINEQNN